MDEERFIAVGYNCKPTNASSYPLSFTCRFSSNHLDHKGAKEKREKREAKARLGPRCVSAAMDSSAARRIQGPLSARAAKKREEEETWARESFSLFFSDEPQKPQNGEIYKKNRRGGSSYSFDGRRTMRGCCRLSFIHSLLDPTGAHLRAQTGPF